MTNSNWKPVPHKGGCKFGIETVGESCWRDCSGTRWHGYGERVGDFAGVWALTGWLAGLKPEQRPFGFLHVYPEGYDFTLESPDYDDPEAIVRPLYASPVTPAAQPDNYHGTTLVSSEESTTVQRLRARVAELEAAVNISDATIAALRQSLGDMHRMRDEALAKREAVAVPDATGEREAAEEAYTRRAFDYEQNPVGSRDWTLFWSGWCARAVLATRQPSAQVPDDVARLDWLNTQRQDMVDRDQHGEPMLIGHAWGCYGQCETVREAIDAALLAAQQQKGGV